jgi:hypothetical protein
MIRNGMKKNDTSIVSATGKLSQAIHLGSIPVRRETTAVATTVSAAIVVPLNQIP